MHGDIETMTISPWIQEAYSNKTWLMTRGGDKRRVICVDAANDKYPVIVLTERGIPTRLAADGKCWYGRLSDVHSEDLLPPKRKFDVCVMQRPDGAIGYYRADEVGIFICGGYTLLARATIEEGEGI